MGKTGMLMIGVSRFIYGEGVVMKLPEEIKRFADSAFFVGGSITLPLVRDKVEEKLKEEQKYTIEDIYQKIEKGFARYRLQQEIEDDGTRVFSGTGNRRDYGAFGLLITTLSEKSWFMDYVIKWVWYNSDRGRDENDFSVEDVLYFYTKRESAA